MKNLVIILSLGSFLFLSCKSKEVGVDPKPEHPKQQQTLVKANRITGVLKPQGITTYQYGTHTITYNNKVYALHSDTVELNNYVEKYVELTVVKIAGYPVDGGPEYLKVLRIKELKK